KRRTPQVTVVGMMAVGWLVLGALDLGSLQLGGDRPHNIQRHLVLKIEDVSDFAIVTLGPDMCARIGLDELTGNPNAIADFAYAPFQHIADAKLAADLLDVHGSALVSEA